MSDPDLDQAAAYSQLISDICRLSNGSRQPHDVEREVFQILGFEVRPDSRRGIYLIYEHDRWHAMPRILSDFGTAIRYTIGNRHGRLDHPLEDNWYVASMCETSEEIEDGKIAAWAVRLAKSTGLRSRQKFKGAVAVNPACALVAAYLRTLG